LHSIPQRTKRKKSRKRNSGKVLVRKYYLKRHKKDGNRDRQRGTGRGGGGKLPRRREETGVDYEMGRPEVSGND